MENFIFYTVIARVFNECGATQAVGLWTLFGMLVFSKTQVLQNFRSYIWPCYFSVIDGFRWFWMRSLPNSIQLNLVFLKA